MFLNSEPVPNKLQMFKWYEFKTKIKKDEVVIKNVNKLLLTYYINISI